MWHFCRLLLCVTVVFLRQSALVCFWSTTASDPNLASTYRQYLCAAGLFAISGYYRLRRQSANTCHRHRQIVLCSTTSDSERPGLSSTTCPADTNRSLVVSKVDYCCSVLAGVSGHLLDRLQSILNAAARFVFSARRFKRITLLLHDLHWLWVPERIQFCLCILAFRCLNGSAPPYLAQSIRRTTDVEGCCHLRSSTTMTLVVLSVQRSTLGDRAFPVTASRAWNSLLPAIQITISSLIPFWQQLQTG